MNAISFLYKYIGPVFFVLLPLSIITLTIVLHVVYSTLTKNEISEWVEILLAHLKETSVLIGFCGSIYALTNSFNINGASSAEIRNRMFLILSTGFWSSLVGILISLKAGIGLLLMKRI